jgi:galactofuranosylgalactofuranosylrhamnosyl-N-acetylglucosaminyl-diphospho-decaprenol beta-1,5/1,6-galactofuranosyltransferase
MRHAAIRNVLEGPGQLHADMLDRLPRVRALGAQFRESKLLRDPAEMPKFAARDVPEVVTGRPNPGPRGLRLVSWLLSTTWRHAMRRPSGDATRHPSAHLPYQDARWFEVSRHDSVLISNAEGSGATWHVRDPRTFRSQLVDAVRLNLRVRKQWAELSTQYRDALPEITSAETWDRSLRGTAD